MNFPLSSITPTERKERTLKSALWLLSLPDTYQSLLLEGPFKLLRLRFISRAGGTTSEQPGFDLLAAAGALSRATTTAECRGKTHFVRSNTSFSLCVASWDYCYFRCVVLVPRFCWSSRRAQSPTGPSSAIPTYPLKGNEAQFLYFSCSIKIKDRPLCS